MNVASTKFSLPGFACAIIVGLAACSQEAEQDQAPANRAYSGRSTASGDVRVTLLQSGNAVRGYGRLGAEEFALSAVLSLEGPAVLSFADGRRIEGRLSLAANDSSITLTTPAERLSMSPDAVAAAPSADASSPFTGSFTHEDSLGVQLLKIDLSGRGSLLTGAGTNAGKNIGLVATKTTTGAYNGLIVFGDGSNVAITLKQHEGSNDLNLSLVSGASYRLKAISPPD